MVRRVTRPWFTWSPLELTLNLSPGRHSSWPRKTVVLGTVKSMYVSVERALPLSCRAHHKDVLKAGVPPCPSNASLAIYADQVKRVLHTIGGFDKAKAGDVDAEDSGIPPSSEVIPVAEPSHNKEGEETPEKPGVLKLKVTG